MPRVPPTVGPVGSNPPREAPPEYDLLPPREPAGTPPRRRRRLWPWILWTLVALVLLAAASPLLAVLALRYVAPPTTAFMLQSPVKPVQYEWVPMAQIPPALARAAVASEDQKFFEHNGFDFEAIEKALASNRTGKKIRGASTISQQVAKNLFLWPSRSYVRKGFEVGATVAIEGLWTKDRILEVYLNIAEFGPGIYGAEAAARSLFGKPAAKLTAAECAQLVAVLPNPRKWKAARPGPYVQRRTDWILGQLGHRPRYAAVPAEEPLIDYPASPADPSTAHTADEPALPDDRAADPESDGVDEVDSGEAIADDPVDPPVDPVPADPRADAPASDPA